MKRYHLFEFGDQKWLPSVFRKTLTDVLEFQTSIIYRFALPKLMRAIYQSEATSVLDLCSGSGGPWRQLFPIIQKKARTPIEVVLSDKFPVQNFNSSSDDAFLKYHAAPIDAMAVPKSLASFRTMFTAFHHFPLQAAKQVLKDAVDSNQPIAIFEFTERKKERVKTLLKNPFSIYSITKHLQPLSTAQKFWMYIIPVIPLIYFWDGIVSHLRTYTPHELEKMTQEISNENYDWEVGEIEIPNLPNRITYLIGLPK